jgi:trimeric autotransporter adhesin
VAGNWDIWILGGFKMKKLHLHLGLAITLGIIALTLLTTAYALSIPPGDQPNKVKDINDTTVVITPKHIGTFIDTTIYGGMGTVWATNGTLTQTKMLEQISQASASAPILEIGTGLLFKAGSQLWHTDGTDENTYRVSRLDSDILAMLPINDETIIATQYALWNIDETVQETRLLYDAGPEAWLRANGLMPGANELYFTVHHGDPESTSLWTTDGTITNTVSIITHEHPINLLAYFDSRLWFAARDSQANLQLWVSDGTITGTHVFEEFNPSGGSSPGNAIATENLLFFTAYKDPTTKVLYATDGTESGTIELQSGNITALATLDDRLLFRFGNGELWVSDGTVAGTEFVLDINGEDNHFNPFRDIWGVYHGRFYFMATESSDISAIPQLWVTNGTESGTYRLTNFAQAWFYAHVGFTPVGNKIYFAGISVEDSSRTQLWQTDGTVGGTFLVKDLALSIPITNPWDLSVNEFWPADTASNFYFTLAGSLGEGQLWYSDGSEAGTHFLQLFAPTTASSDPIHITGFNGDAYFLAIDVGLDMPSRHYYRNLWVSDGTEANTKRVSDFNLPSDQYRYVDNFVSYQESLYFAVHSRVDHHAPVPPDGNKVGKAALWRSDGTEMGTGIVYVFEPPVDFMAHTIQSLQQVGNSLLFNLVTYEYIPDPFGGGKWGQTACSNWYANTTGGIEPFLDFCIPEAIELSYNRSTFSIGPQLWSTNGRSWGTYHFATIPHDPFEYPPTLSNWVNHQDKLYFTSLVPALDQESALWHTDGTQSGTTVIKTFHLSSGTTGLFNLQSFQDYLVFVELRVDSQTTLWLSDGTESGTVPLLSDDIIVVKIQVVHDKLFIVTRDEAWQKSLWVLSDLDSDLILLADGLTTDSLTSLNRLLLFVVKNVEHDYELWQTDGTLAGTAMIAGIEPAPRHLANVANLLFFSASDTLHGRELWRYTVPNLRIITEQQRVYAGDEATNYELALTTQPASPVTITMTMDEQIVVVPTQVVFTVDNWHERVAIQVTAVDDDEILHGHKSIIIHTVETDDPEYQNIHIEPLVFTVIDNDFHFIHLPAVAR